MYLNVVDGRTNCVNSALLWIVDEGNQRQGTQLRRSISYLHLFTSNQLLQNPIRTHQTHQNPSEPIKPIKTHQNPSKPIKTP